jgi:hypothetical protein
MSDGFLGRWSRRKLEAGTGKPSEPQPAAPATEGPPPAADADVAMPASAPAAGASAQAPRVQTVEIPPQLPPPTLEDVKALTGDSDFSRFAARDVAPEVKNAALKKLFAEPRYNVMDGLDVYIGDYSKPAPLPSHLARQLAGAAFLKLFDEPEQAADAQARDDADDRPHESVAQSATDSAVPSHDADPDLRLQQDDAAGRGEPGPDTA